MTSQYGQDLFVLEVLAGLRGGFFLDSGASDGVCFSNTLLLEESFSRELGQALLDARGLSVDHLFRTIPNVDVECLAKRGYVTELSEEAERNFSSKSPLNCIRAISQIHPRA